MSEEVDIFRNIVHIQQNINDADVFIFLDMVLPIAALWGVIRIATVTPLPVTPLGHSQVLLLIFHSTVRMPCELSCFCRTRK